MTQESIRGKAKITVNGLSLSLEGQPKVLKNISVNFVEKKISALIGPSGSGKSTLLRCLNRLWEPPVETVYFDEQDITSLDVLSLRQRVGMVLQSAILFPGSVGDNVNFGPNLHGKPISRERVKELLEMVSLEGDIIDKAADSLSGGQAQRVSIARTLANEPEVLLLDEPTSALDPSATRSVEETLRRLRDELGLTVILVSHSLDQVGRIADFSTLLVKGEIAESGTPDHLLSGIHHHWTEEFAEGRLSGKESIKEA
ncbi:MAG: phosphate ABC transporter ATP-binding protein [Chloroflexota bacterium]